MSYRSRLDSMANRTPRRIMHEQLSSSSAQENLSSHTVSSRNLEKRVEQLEQLLQEERQVRESLETRTQEHADGLHILMDVLQDSPAEQQDLSQQLQELAAQVEKRLLPLEGDVAALHQAVGAANLSGLDESVKAAMQAVEETLTTYCNGQCNVISNSMVEISEAVDAIREHVTEQEQQLAAVHGTQDTNHKLLENSLGIRFDKRLVVLENVMNSLEIRVKSELATIDNKVQTEVAKLAELERKLTDGMALKENHLIGLFDKGMATFDSQHVALVNRIETRVAQLQRELVSGGELAEVKDAIERMSQLQQRLESSNELADAKSKIDRLSGDTNRLLADNDTRIRELDTKIGETSETAKQAATKCDVISRTIRDLEKSLAAEKQRVDNEIAGLEKRCGVDGSELQELKVSTRQNLDRVEQQLAGQCQELRTEQAQLQAELLTKISTSADELRQDVGLLKTKIATETDRLDSEVHNLGSVVGGVEQRSADALAKAGLAKDQELHDLQTRVESKIRTSGQDLKARIDIELSKERSRIDHLEMLQRAVDDANRRAADRTAELEAQFSNRVAQAEAKAKAGDESILDGWRRFSGQLQAQISGLDRKVETVGQTVGATASAQMQRQAADFKAEINRLDAADRGVQAELYQTEKQVREKLADESAEHKAGLKRVRDRFESNLQAKEQTLTDRTDKAVANLRADTENRLVAQSDLLQKAIADSTDRVNQLGLDLNATVAEAVSKQKSTLKQMAAQNRQEIEEGIRSKADQKEWIYRESQLQEKIMELQDAVKQLSEEIEDERGLLDSHTEQLETIEEEVQDHSTDFAMMDATVHSISEDVQQEGARNKGAVDTLRDQVEEQLRGVQVNLEATSKDLKEQVLGSVFKRLGAVETRLETQVASEFDQVKSTLKAKADTQLMENKNLNVLMEIQELKDAKDSTGNLIDDLDDLHERVEVLEDDLKDMQADAAMDKAFLLSH